MSAIAISATTKPSRRRGRAPPSPPVRPLSALRSKSIFAACRAGADRMEARSRVNERDAEHATVEGLTSPTAGGSGSPLPAHPCPTPPAAARPRRRAREQQAFGQQTADEPPPPRAERRANRDLPAAAPSARASNRLATLAQAMSSRNRPRPAEVSKPSGACRRQSVSCSGTRFTP